LKSDPANTKALSLSGSYAFERKDYKEAIRLWEKVVQIGPAEDPVVEQAQTSLTDARALVGIPPLATADTSAKTVAAPGAATVGGVVKLSPALLKQVKPEDTLFVFARAAEGSRMPLAIVRKQVKDLPYTFTLDDSTSMSPNAKLSTSGKVIVGARISKSGNAIPAAGDLSGQSQPTSVGAKDLSIEISEVVKL
jgi:cytochrome c-type biogenesis protein CcmH